jgi:arsenate reductase
LKNYNVLFLCTGNSARSIMAEALVTVKSKGRFIGYSAGSHPAGSVNPLAIEMIKPTGYPLDKLRSKNWDEFALPDAPQMDFIITVCDNAAGEVCPLWPGRPATAHWGFPDPAAVEGTMEEKRAAFSRVYHGIDRRIQLLLALRVETLDSLSLQTRLREIGKSPATT